MATARPTNETEPVACAQPVSTAVRLVYGPMGAPSSACMITGCAVCAQPGPRSRKAGVRASGCSLHVMHVAAGSTCPPARQHATCQCALAAAVVQGSLVCQCVLAACHAPPPLTQCAALGAQQCAILKALTVGMLARVRLLANAYSLHITHLTTGMRIGAAAAEKLDLFPVSCSAPL